MKYLWPEQFDEFDETHRNARPWGYLLSLRDVTIGKAEAALSAAKAANDGVEHAEKALEADKVYFAWLQKKFVDNGVWFIYTLADYEAATAYYNATTEED